MLACRLSPSLWSPRGLTNCFSLQKTLLVLPKLPLLIGLSAEVVVFLSVVVRSWLHSGDVPTTHLLEASPPSPLITVRHIERASRFICTLSLGCE